MGPGPLVLPAESPMVEARHDRAHLPDTERLEKRFEPYTKMTAAAVQAKGGKRKAGAKHPGPTPVA